MTVGISFRTCYTNPNFDFPYVRSYSLRRDTYEINFQSHSLAYCIKMATTVEQLDSQSNCLIEQLRIILQTRITRCSEYVINEFTHDEITE